MKRDLLQEMLRCIDEMQQARRAQRPGDMGALMGEMDWWLELRSLIKEARQMQRRKFATEAA